jgi:enoyl reductase
MSVPATAKAVRIVRAGGPEVLEYVDVPVREPERGEVVVALRAVGVNPVEVKIRKGDRGAITEPRPIGADGAGVVVARGEGVASLKEGDAVIGWGLPGAYAQYVTAPATTFVEKPEAVSFEEAAAIGIPVGTAYQCLKSVGLQAGHTLLVHAGSGAVGQAAIQLALLWDAKVIATSSERNFEYLEQLGATPVAYGDGLLDRLRRIAPDGVDRVLDAAGTQEAIDASLALVEQPEHIVEIVVPGWHEKYGVLVFSGGLPGSMGPAELALRAEAVPFAAGLAAEGRFRIEVGSTFPLERAADAHRLLESGMNRGKIVLIP